MNWELQVIPDGNYFKGIDFWDENHGIIISNEAAYKTIDGGQNWTEQPIYNAQSSLRSLDVVNDTLSFIGAVNLLKSVNGGESWDSIQMPNSLWPDDIEFLNDNIGYLVSGPSVKTTENGGQTWYSVSTACLDNSWDLNKIEVVDEHHVYNAGKTSMSRLWSGPPMISTVLAETTFCPEAKFNVAYFYEGEYYFDNTYVAQLSDASGSFDSPTTIGQYFSPFVAINPSNIISCELPPGLPSGNNYHIRVIGTDPLLVGSGIPISIFNNITPDLSLTMSGENCPDSELFFEATFTNEGPLPQFLWIVNGTPIEHNSYTWLVDSLAEGDQVQVQMTSDLSCANPVVSFSDILTITSNSPNITISSDTIICAGAMVSLFASGGESYLWSPSTGLDDPSSPTPTASPLQSTIYTVVVTSQGGCTASENVMLEVQPPLELNISNDTTILIGTSVNLFATGAENYIWSPATFLDDPTSGMPICTPEIDITYEVIGTDIFGCTSIDSVTIMVLFPQLPLILDFEASDTTIFVGEQITFNNTTSGPISEWLWTFEGGNPELSVDSIPGLITYGLEGCYEVSLLVSNLGGSDSLEKTCYIEVIEEIIIDGVREIEEGVLIWPNPVRDEFTIEFTEARTRNLKIYNNLGQLVFRNYIVEKENKVIVNTWASGIYTLLWQEDETTRAAKFFVSGM